MRPSPDLQCLLQSNPLLHHSAEHIVVDVDDPEQTPHPFKVCRMDNLEPSDASKHGTAHLGWNVEICVNHRELVKHPAITKTDDDGNNVVIRPPVDPFLKV